MQRDHGGNIDAAMAAFGGEGWIDLSTGINRLSYPLGDIPPQVWQALPTEAARRRLITASASWFGCAPERVLPVAGASAAIQLLPRQGAPGRAVVLRPSYNEHAASLRSAGWSVEEVAGPDAMAGADLAVIVNPNNPDGREWAPEAVVTLAGQVGHLIVDESFADPRPDLTVAGRDLPNVTVLRSFGKFWGLAGLRLGFVIAAPDRLAALAEAAGPWAVNGPALEVGARALADKVWADDAVVYLSEATLRLDALALRAGWQVVGGTHLFRLYDTPDAGAAQKALAKAQIWTRVFPYSPHWLRMGIPGRDEWNRVIAAFTRV